LESAQAEATSLNAVHDCILTLLGPLTPICEYLLELVSTLTYNPSSCAPVVPKCVTLALMHPALSPSPGILSIKAFDWLEDLNGKYIHELNMAF
jgi:hypothetical protein